MLVGVRAPSGGGAFALIYLSLLWLFIVYGWGNMMSTTTTEADLDKRLTAVERTVASILMRMQKSEPAPGWLKQFRGCMADEPGFKDLVRYGREIRDADRPADDDAPS